MSVETIDDVERLRRINQALVNRVERAMDQSQNAFSLFQTAISLEGQVRRRTDELSATLRVLERSNSELATQKEISEKANSLKTRFLAAASHDLLQPLHAAQLTISALAELQETVKGRALAGQVERSLDTMNELLRTLLDISRLDAGAMEPVVGAVAVAPIVESIVADFRPVAEAKGLRLHAHAAALTVRSDRTMLRRIVLNLVANAVRYTARGGVVVALRQRRGQAFVEVIDSGRGIPPAEHQRVFEEFHRLGPTGEDGEPGGLGLGLSIVRRLVDTLGHELVLHSRVGHGTRFRLGLGSTIAAETAETSDAAVIAPLGVGLAGARILLIENEPSVRAATADLMESWGCSLRAEPGFEGACAATADGWIPDLIIADQHLDRGELGVEAIARLRALAGRAFPAIIATADAGETTLAGAAAIGAHVLQKPLKPAQLRALATHLVATGPDRADPEARSG